MPGRSITAVSRSVKKTVLALAVVFVFQGSSTAQHAGSSNSAQTINPLLRSSFKKQPAPRSDLNEHFKRPDNQLMFWPHFPLTAWQIEQRDRKYDRTVGQQLASSIAESYVNYLLYGRNRKPVASIPKF